MNNEPIYLDTNIIMDFLLGRDRSAFQLILRVISCEFQIIISELVVKELYYQDLNTETQNLSSLLKNSHKLFIDRVQDSDHITANELVKVYNTHYSDALHKAIAKRNNVRYIVTKNIKDFECFDDINAARPDEI
jgi:predicted nucleic acid-binding protein